MVTYRMFISSRIKFFPITIDGQVAMLPRRAVVGIEKNNRKALRPQPAKRRREERKQENHAQAS